jgi:hypothetical protein
MREEFLLDVLGGYQIEPEDPTRIIPNPERRTFGQGDPRRPGRCRQRMQYQSEIECLARHLVLEHPDTRGFMGNKASKVNVAWTLEANRPTLPRFLA